MRLFEMFASLRSCVGSTVVVTFKKGLSTIFLLRRDARSGALALLPRGRVLPYPFDTDPGCETGRRRRLLSALRLGAALEETRPAGTCTARRRSHSQGVAPARPRRSRAPLLLLLLSVTTPAPPYAFHPLDGRAEITPDPSRT